jgi:hypothetical protein
VLWLSALALLTMPLALLVVSWVAVQARPRLGMAAAVIAWLGFANLAFLITPDQAALAGHEAGLPTTTTAALLSAIDQNPVASTATTLFVAGHILGVVLLGVALWRFAFPEGGSGRSASSSVMPQGVLCATSAHGSRAAIAVP